MPRLLIRRRLDAGYMAAFAAAIWLAVVVSVANDIRAEESANGEAHFMTPLMRGLGVHDPRGRLDPEQLPWRAVGKLQAISTNFRASCTGTLVGPSMVLTAAHCVYNPRTQTDFSAGSVHFLIGYSGSRLAGHAIGVKIVTAPSYDAGRAEATMGSDWALIWLDTRLGSPDRVLPIIGEPVPVGSYVMLGGYQQDHPRVLMADTECRIIGRVADASGRHLLRHNCAGTGGVSGAPLLTERGGKWYVAGIDVAAQTGVASGVAVIPNEVRTQF